jgi:hypothetical protein
MAIENAGLGVGDLTAHLHRHEQVFLEMIDVGGREAGQFHSDQSDTVVVAWIRALEEHARDLLKRYSS